MTEQGYCRDIRRKCESLGVWRAEFDKPLRRLAKLYVRIDKVEAEFEVDGQTTVEHTNKAGATNVSRNPLLMELNALYDQALTLERELGLTAAALKKINEDALGKKPAADPLTAALTRLTVVSGDG